MATLLYDDVVTNGETQAGSFPSWFGGEEWIEHLLLDLGWYASAVIANPDFDPIAEVSCEDSKGWFKAIIARRHRRRSVSRTCARSASTWGRTATATRIELPAAKCCAGSKNRG